MDAEAMREIAVNRLSYQFSETITGENATYEKLSRSIDRAAKDMGPGDMFMLTISSAGFTENGETSLLLYEETELPAPFNLRNARLTASQLSGLLSRFVSGVRIVVIVDASHSEGMVTLDPIPGNVVFIGSSLYNQYNYGPSTEVLVGGLSLFTRAFAKVYKNPFNGTYKQLRKAIDFNITVMAPSNPEEAKYGIKNISAQNPVYKSYGTIDASFVSGKAFNMFL